MTLTIDCYTFENVVVSKNWEIVENDYVNRFRTLNGTLITQIIQSSDKKNEYISLIAVNEEGIQHLLKKKNRDVTAALVGAGVHDFFDTYNLEIPGLIQNSYNGTQNLDIILHKL